ncbi:MAG: MlaD family protein [Thalassotalea sp.]
MTTNSSAPVTVTAKEKISAIWFVPIIACLFGAWLVYKNIADRGVFITVEFDSASGIVAGKTKVKYKGLDTGIVRKVEISDNLQTVLVDIEMVKSSKQALTENTKFWFVTADITLQGIKGLDTLLSGSYINVQPDLAQTGKAQRYFVALDEQPPLDESVRGLHLQLLTDTLGSIAKGSPVSYKQITVGYVSNYHYTTDNKKIELSLFIEPEHAHLVKANSRFWNASGFDIMGSLTNGFKIKTQSLAAIVSGGIAFDSSTYEEPGVEAKNGDSFHLYNDFNDAEMSTEITLALEQDSGIDIGAEILFEGMTLGRVTSFIHIDPHTRKIQALAQISPRIEKYLTENTDFFIVSPQLDLNGSKNLSAILTGPYIGLRPSLKGTKQTSFNVYQHKPAYKYNVPGLHIMLSTTDISSVSVGTGIYYKKQLVGDVQAIENIGPDQFFVHIFIKPQYQQYISSDSRFWHDSGITISGGLQKFEIQAKSLNTILTGGISFDTGRDFKKQPVQNGDDFQLYQSQDIAQQRIEFTLEVASSRDFSTNTRIMYRGEKIGEVHQILNQGVNSLVKVGVIPSAEHILKADSQFWLVKPDVTLSGITDTEALFGGAYIAVNVGEGKSHQHFKLHLTPPAKHSSTQGLQLSLTSNSGNVVSPGSAISYRGITVGQVDNISLDEVGKQVRLNITIYDEYRHLITNYTRFYNASGITINGGLSNFTLKTESADAMLRGAISFYNPEQGEQTKAAAENSHYSLYDHFAHAESAGLAIEIHFNNFSGLQAKTKIKYQQQDVGIVERLVFDENGLGVTAYAFLNDSGRRFAVQGTKMWLAEPEFGLVGAKNVSDIFSGGSIHLLPGHGQAQTRFTAAELPPVITQLPYGLNVKLNSRQLGSVRVGNPVLYRQVKVGSVIGVGLSDTADSVDIYINIATRYAPLVNEKSKFWNTSGFSIDAGIFSGVTVNSQSMETLLAGGIAFATPVRSPQAQPNSADQQQFHLYDQVRPEWLSWQPSIQLAEE